MSKIVTDAHALIVERADTAYYRSDDQGLHWIRIRSGDLPRHSSDGGDSVNAELRAAVRSLPVSEVNLDVPQGHVPIESLPFTSSVAKLLCANRGVNQIEWLPVDSDMLGYYRDTIGANIFAMYDYQEGFCRSSDKGKTWYLSRVVGTASAHHILAFGNRLLLLTNQDGFYGSRSGGEHWERLDTANLPELQTRTYISAKVGDVAVAFDDRRGELFRTTDHGKHWLGFDLKIRRFGKIRTLHCIDSTFFLVTAEGVFQSSDLGLTWRLSSPNLGVHPNLVEHEGEEYFPNDSAIFKWDRHQKKWSRWAPIEGGGQLEFSGSIIISSSRRQHSERAHAVLSFDGGSTWKSPPDAFEITNVLAIRDTVVVLTKQHGFYVSKDHGESWSHSNAIGLARYPARECTILSDGPELYLVRNHTEYFRSSDSGSNWEPFSIPADPTLVSFAALGGKALSSVYNQGLFTSSDKGTSWKRTNTFLKENILCTAQQKKTQLVGTQGKGIFRSTNAGMSWKIGKGSVSYEARSMLSVDGVFIAGAYWSNGGILRSSDDGKTWSNTLPHVSVFSLCAARGSLYAGTDSGCYRSVDRGRSWQFIRSLPRSAITVVCATAEHVYAVVRRWPDWTTYETTAGDTDFVHSTHFSDSTFAPIASTKGRLFAVHKTDGILFSADDGRHWRECRHASRVCADDLEARGDSLVTTARIGSSVKTYISTDLAEHWKLIRIETPDEFDQRMKSRYVGQTQPE